MCGPWGLWMLVEFYKPHPKAYKDPKALGFLLMHHVNV